MHPRKTIIVITAARTCRLDNIWDTVVLDELNPDGRLQEECQGLCIQDRLSQRSNEGQTAADYGTVACEVLSKYEILLISTNQRVTTVKIDLLKNKRSSCLHVAFKMHCPLRLCEWSKRALWCPL